MEKCVAMTNTHVAVRVLLLAAFTFLSSSYFLVNALAETRQPEQEIYRFSPAANRLLRICFPVNVKCSGFLVSATRKPNGSIGNLDSVLAQNLEMAAVASYGPRTISLGIDAPESYYLGTRKLPDGAGAILKEGIPESVETLLKDLKTPIQFSSPVEKALFQRDILQVYSVFYYAMQTEMGIEEQSAGARALGAIAAIWPQLVLNRSNSYRRAACHSQIF